MLRVPRVRKWQSLSDTIGTLYRQAVLPDYARCDNGSSLVFERIAQKMPALAVFHFDDPYVGIIRDFTRQPFFDCGFFHRRFTEGTNKKAIGRVRIIKRGLRGGAKKFRLSVEMCDFYKNRARFLMPAPPHGYEGAF